VPGTCGICDEQVVERTNPDGSYKGACADCRENHDRPPRHVEQCGDENCLVCNSHREEFGT